MKPELACLLNVLCLLGYAAGEKFLYFAYGSNLLASRIHIRNPSAVFFKAARLQDYRLDFIKRSEYWRGAAATVVADAGHEVWGALWELDASNMASLDAQEGVHLKWYFPKSVVVTTKEGDVFVARTYEQTINPPALIGNEVLPMERRPSITYLKVIIQGAVECDLPEHYIRYLYKIRHNGRDASPEVLALVGSLDTVTLEDFKEPNRFYTGIHPRTNDILVSK